MIERFYDPINGQIMFEGIDIKELNPRWYHT
jgi:ABC-type multidrug transport system fused ATPase/permease subunit